MRRDINAPTNGVQTQPTYTVTDADVDDNVDDAADADLKWSLSGADASKFDITDTGDMRIL